VDWIHLLQDGMEHRNEPSDPMNILQLIENILMTKSAPWVQNNNFCRYHETEYEFASILIFVCTKYI
jgi:hypothetical protein